MLYAVDGQCFLPDHLHKHVVDNWHGEHGCRFVLAYRQPVALITNDEISLVVYPNATLVETRQKLFEVARLSMRNATTTLR